MESIKPQKTLVEQVHGAILDAICDGTLAAGTAMTQDELAARLQVSRQPVMTALGMLRKQGFLIERGRRGLQVAAGAEGKGQCKGRDSGSGHEWLPIKISR